jgi:hypothetical protein
MNDIKAMKETFVLTKVLFNEAKLWWQTREVFAGPVSAHHVVCMLTLYAILDVEQYCTQCHTL